MKKFFLCLLFVGALLGWLVWLWDLCVVASRYLEGLPYPDIPQHEQTFLLIITVFFGLNLLLDTFSYIRSLP